MIWTALPCTTPRPAPESSACDLASDLWASARQHETAGPHFVRATRAERGRVVNRPIPRRRPRDRGSRINSTDQAIVPQTKGRNPSPRSELYSVTETGLVVATQIESESLDAAYHCHPPASILPSEAFRYNQPDVASHHWPLDQVHVPTVRTCGSSRTSQDYYRNNISPAGRQ